jgi:hypothetical protein
MKEKRLQHERELKAKAEASIAENDQRKREMDKRDAERKAYLE